MNVKGGGGGGLTVTGTHPRMQLTFIKQTEQDESGAERRAGLGHGQGANKLLY